MNAHLGTQGLLSAELTIEKSWKSTPLNCMINTLFIYDIYRWRVKIESECLMNVYRVLVGVRLPRRMKMSETPSVKERKKA